MGCFKFTNVSVVLRLIVVLLFHNNFNNLIENLLYYLSVNAVVKFSHTVALASLFGTCI